MPAEFSYDVFLSHNSEDKAVVRRLAERLRAKGLRVWFDAAGIVALIDVEPLHVATYIEALQARMPPTDRRQNLAAIRMLFDWLATGGILASNPATSARPQTRDQARQDPVLTTDQARPRRLIESIDTSTIVGLRDRALIRA
jgi:site-specific recombinase XerD